MRRRDRIKAEIEEVFCLGESFVRSVDEIEDRFGIRQRVASPDAIRNFCNGIGDVNPLYRSLDHGKNSIHGTLIAPPQFINAIAFPSFKGFTRRLDYITGGVGAGVTTEWFQTIREGDTFSVVSIPREVEDVSKSDTDLRFLIAAETQYRNQQGQAVAVCEMKGILFVNPEGGERKSTAGSKGAPPVRFWSEQEVREWYRLIVDEPIRGADPRYWEDVKVGDRLPPTRHFFTPAQSIAFFSGIAWFEDWRFRMLESESEMTHFYELEPDPAHGILEIPDPGWHLDDSVAQRHGFDRAFCAGKHMECWLGQLVTNWMGDAGFLKSLSCQFRALLYSGSKVICNGEVIGKSEDGDEHLVDLKLTLEDHDGRLAIPDAMATVSLPSRTHEKRKVAL